MPKKLINQFLKYELKTEIIKPFKSNELQHKYDDIKNKLDIAKTQLDKITPENYFDLMKYMDIYLNMKKVLKTNYNMQVTTNASMKMYEMICECKLINDSLNAFCNAELPGAFISTINHYCKTNNISYKWVASSYMPDDEHLGDKYGIYKNHSKNWLMNENNNGDVTNIKNLLDFEKRVKDINLYTSDAGIDVSEDYNNQEDLTLWINYGQILTGLLTLANGGNFCTKQYTFFNPFTRSVITILSYLFDEFYITKPVTSRPSNSEIYLIGKNYNKSKFAKFRDIMLKALENKDLTILCEINENMFESTYDIHMLQQIAFLNELFTYYNTRISMLEKKRLYDYYNNIINDWIKKYNVKMLKLNEYL